MESVPSYIYQTVLMGSDIQLKFYQRCDAAAKQAFALIKQWEYRLTANMRSPAAPADHTDGQAGLPPAVFAEITAINQAAGKMPARVSPPVFALLRRAQAVSLAPQSCFNFAIGPVVKAWNIGFAQTRLPARAELAALLPLTNACLAQFNPEECSVFLPRRDMALDLGAIAKGFIADRVKEFLRGCGIKSALINLGGNVLAFGAPPSEALPSGEGTETEKAGVKSWAVGLQKPFAPKGALLGLIHMADKSVVSSGIYERYFLAGAAETSFAAAEAAACAAGAPAGKQADFYHHIFDPNTGLPLHNDLMGVTIISDSSIDGEIWSSLLYGMGAAAGIKFLSQTPAGREGAADSVGRGDCVPPVLSPPRGLAAIFVTKDKRIILPAGREDFRFTALDSSYQLEFYG